MFRLSVLFSSLALGNRCSAHMLLKQKCSQAAWHSPVLLSPLLGLWTWGLHTATCSSPPDERQRFLWAPHPEKVPDMPCSVFAGLVSNGSGGVGELRSDSHQGRACLGLNACLREEWGHGPHPSVPQWWGNTSRVLDQTLPYLPAGMAAMKPALNHAAAEGRETFPGMPFTDQHQPPANSYCSLSKRNLILTHILFTVWLVHCNNF